MKYFISLLIASLVSCLFAAPVTVSSTIHVDQFGYLPAAKKIAVLTDPVLGYNEDESYTPGGAIELRDWYTDEVVFSGIAEEWNSGAMHSQSGDRCWWFDFSSVQVDGDYYVHDLQNNLSSGHFEISDCVYREPMMHAMRTFYYQRCGLAKEATFANAAWSDDACHLGAFQDSECYPYNSGIGVRDMSGGWHDAGDYNKYVNFAFEPVLDLCDAAINHPDIWTEFFNLPESGNGTEDIKDEIKYELDWLLKMQNQDGSVHCMVGAESYDAASPPSSDDVNRVYGPVTTAATLSVAAMFARAAELYSGTYAMQLEMAANAAWEWAQNNPDVTFYNSGIIVSGEQEPSAYEVWSRKMIAAIYLFHLTNNDTYKVYVEENYSDAHLIQWSYAYPFESALQNALLFFAHEANVSNNVSEAIIDTYIQSVSSWNADNLPAYLDGTDPYMAHLSDQNYTWGSNTTKSRQGNIFQNMNLYNLDETNAVNYQEAAAGFLHYMHGVNPNNTVFLTNMNQNGSEKSVNSIYHGWFGDGSTLWDEAGVSIFGPAPGFVPGGPNPTYALDVCCSGDCGAPEFNALCNTAQVTPPLNQPIQKAWLDWNTSWPQNSWTVTEIGIYTQAAYIKLLASFIEQGCLVDSGIAESTVQKLSLRLFPNPCQNEMVVSTELLLPGSCELKIFDSTGRMIYSEQINSRSGKTAQVIDTSNLHDGIYFLTMESDNAKRHERFVVCKGK
jgi:endoglucanase